MLSFRPLLAAAAAALALSTPLMPALAHEGHTHATAEDAPVQVADAYARVSETGSGAVFFVMHNVSGTDDVLIGAKSDVAEKVELHTHKMDANGVMQMVAIEGGIPLPAEGMHALERGGDHVMLMGLKGPMKDGDTFALTLVFQNAGDVTFDVTVDNARKPGKPGMEGMDHSAHTSGSGG